MLSTFPRLTVLEGLPLQRLTPEDLDSLYTELLANGRRNKGGGWPADDGYSAARIEEEVWVTADGPVFLTRFPSEELLVLGQRYWNGVEFAKGRNDITEPGMAGVKDEAPMTPDSSDTV